MGKDFPWWYALAKIHPGAAVVYRYFAKGGILLAIFCIVSVSTIRYASAEEPPGAETAPYAWESALEELVEQRDQLLMQLESARDVLLLRAQTENSDFLARLHLEKPRRRGYQIVAPIQEDKPLAFVTPVQSTYSLEALRKQATSNLHEAAQFTEQVSAKPNLTLAALVIEFERLRGQLANLESHLAYHSNWQRAAVEQRAFFAERNRIAAIVREIQSVQESVESAERVATLRQTVRERVTKFTASARLAIETNAEGIRVLTVTVYTDIEDDSFLEAFREGVEAAFTHSEAARQQRFAVSLNIRRVAPIELYPAGVPMQGAAIDIKDHLARFPRGALILTTGGESTHAWVGRNITLGPNPITRRTLAHEFGHLLGFSDAYLRSYQGDPRDPYGVVFIEWTGLVNNLMGSPGVGRVTDEMIETLIAAYGESQHQ